MKYCKISWRNLKYLTNKLSSCAKKNVHLDRPKRGQALIKTLDLNTIIFIKTKTGVRTQFSLILENIVIRPRLFIISLLPVSTDNYPP